MENEDDMSEEDRIIAFEERHAIFEACACGDVMRRRLWDRQMDMADGGFASVLQRTNDEDGIH